ncbi:MAG: S8 family peptidase [Arcticibacter sp.]
MKHFKTKLFVLFAYLVSSLPSYAQEAATEQDEMQHWQHACPSDGQYWGVSANSARLRYKDIDSGRTIVVAVIDGGVDTTHPDLKANLWINKNEISGNGIDDDKNGYVDDVHGWNFIGGPKGDIGPENTEAVRLYRKLISKYSGKEKKDVSKQDRSEFALYKAAEAKVLMELLESSNYLSEYASAKKHLDKIVSIMGDDEFSSDELRGIKDDDQVFMATVEAVAGALENEVPFNKIYDDVGEGYNYFNVSVNYHYNTDFDGRSVVGDNPEDFSNTIYGNNNVMGPDAGHGTHVAGIIGAIRNNGMGIDGIASNVRIMVIRAVPDGDERDKDVGNAIRYAVDNGANIINMSFGKSFSPNKTYVDDAIAYAASKNVLMVHAAGNDGLNTDKEPNFPNAKSFTGSKSEFPWIEVGAISSNGQIAEFSNFGGGTVDILAPGASIYSTLPGAKYDFENGTSMAAPVVSGVAALIWSHYPELSATQLKKAMMTGAIQPEGKTNPGGAKKAVPFKKVCKSAGAVNALTSIILLESR